MTDALRDTEAAITAIEATVMGGIRIIPVGSELDVDISGCTDTDQAETLMGVLRQNKSAVTALTSSQPAAKKILVDAHAELTKADEYVHAHMDLWLRLETAYRNLWPDDKVCITSGQCGDSRAIVRCQACDTP
jgi:Ni,Fe-hydrogenase III small subunit